MKGALYIYLVALVSVIFAGCSSGSSDDMELSDGSVSFHSSIDSYTTRSGAKSSWSSGDKVQVASSLTSGVDGEELEFVTYSASASGALSADDDKIFYIDGESNSYFAIYPVGRISEGYYVVDLTDQTTATTDILYATTTVENQNMGSIALNFSHKVTMLQFDIDGSVYDLDGAKATLRGAFSKGLFNLKLGRFDSFGVADIDLRIEPVAGGDYTIELSMLPWQNTLDLELIIDDGEDVYIFKPRFVDENGDVIVLEAGTVYKYDID